MARALGDLQQLTMLAVARLGDGAYGGSIRDELEGVAARDVSVSTVYVTLVRLEDDGLVESEREPDDANDRGGRPRRYFRLTAEGVEALRASREAMERMWAGVELRTG